MATRNNLYDWVHEALMELGGSGTIVQIAKEIWKSHKEDLQKSGDLFYTWQYDMRWAANKMRKNGVMKSASVSPHGIWELKA